MNGSRDTLDQDTTAPFLFYAGEKLNPEPLISGNSISFTFNQSLQGVAMWLALGHAKVVRLEPGDGTRYELLLVPMWNDMTRLDGCLPFGHGYLFVAMVVGGKVKAASTLMMGALRAHSLHEFPEGWTRTFLAWWLNKLWQLVEPRLMPMDREAANAR